MRILFACGGTAGHINPAIAVARKFLEKHPESQVLFVGADGEMETRLVPREGFEIRTVTVSGFYRKWNLKSLRFNIKTLRKLCVSHRQANQIVDEFRPDLVMGTGGYASYPVVRCAAKRGIPTLIHESNAVPGLTTRVLSRFADRVMVSFEESRQRYPHPDRVVVTGTPVREEFFRYRRQEARELLGLSDDRPLVLSFWGSLGARDMNRKMVDFIRLAGESDLFHHIHAAGRSGYGWMPEALLEAGVDLEKRPSLRLLEYIFDMPRVMAAADLVICRAGASTLAELTALAKPCILVPSPNVTNNHQERNARLLEKRGGAVVLTEDGLSGAQLYETAKQLVGDAMRLDRMKSAQSAMSIPDAAERIYAVAMEVYKEKR